MRLQLRMSLARKCQLLFGAAAVLIIGAALVMPWRRMEQLTEQLNERAANAVVQTVLAQHIEQHAAARPQDLGQTDAAVAPEVTEGPEAIEAIDGAEADDGTQAIHGTDDANNAAAPPAGDAFVPPRLIALRALEQQPDALSEFDRRALQRFIANPQRPIYWRDYDNGTRFRYAQALFATQRCITCHATPGATQSAAADVHEAQEPQETPDDLVGPEQPVVATQPASRNEPLIGMISLDMPSQLEPNQLLLNRVLILTAGAMPGLLAIVIFSLIISRLILRPVRVLQETAEKVSEGDLNIRSDISSGDEFQQLSETFNTMLINLKNSADQLRAVNKSLDLRLGQLAESNVALYESNRLKSEFLANVSHELRTPLNSILGFADLLRDLAAGEADAKTVRYVQNILRSGNHLLDLINDLLDLAKIEAGRMEVRSEPLSIADVFEGLASLLKPMLESKQLKITTRLGADVPIVHTDPAKLQQMLYNFLSNAIKFSPPGETIDLVAERESGGVRISVTDRGPGIAPEKQAIIFEKFRQIDGSVTREHSGTGLGLAISKELATLLGGSIGVESTPGQGATFWLTLPLRIEAGPQDVRSTLVLS